ncbi:NB-ARC domain-containing protein [Amycolatopsis sp. OK19-0408]|uniref:NB-ARC domain-containing protein n=1 Tax=Amycolatopsis iheyensis TaxID=2945988 RepID=A0A9X2SMP4_9PSEU|nr:tetratricopeptide repeat protein [Amycolatopsis iheyensis]MCR6487839.1 NB-ARC domain-containing protein [Amycolatopsis iheyensis]
MTIDDGQEHAPAEMDVEAENAVAAVAVSGTVIQAHKITGGVHHHPPRPTRPVPRQLPPVPHSFVGRVDLLADLGRSAATDGPATLAGGRPRSPIVAISAIGGAGGIGKTWLALAWAHRNLHRFPDGQLFVDLRSFSPTGRPASPVDVLGAFLDALGIDRDRQPNDADRRASLYRSLVADRRLLIVLDNAATTEQVAPLLPGSHQCTVLVTSRNHLHGLAVRYGARPVHLDVLSDVEAHTLLSTALGPERAADEDAVVELIQLCGGFPLALGLIAARAAADPRLPLVDTVAELRDLGLDAFDSDDPTASLPAVLSWSLRHLTDQQRAVFALLGTAPGPTTGLAAAAALTDLPQREAHTVLRALADASLVDRAPGGRYGMHELVGSYAARTADNLPEGFRESALRRLLDFYTHTAHDAARLLYPHGDPVKLEPLGPGVRAHPLADAPAALTWLDLEHVCLLAAQHTAIRHGWHSTVLWLAWGLDSFHALRGHRDDRLVVWRAAAEAAPHLSDPFARIRAYRSLGRAHAGLGHHDDAVAQLHHALALAEQHDDPNQQAHAHRILALTWGRRGDDRQALEHASRALDLYRGLQQSVGEAAALNEVGWYAARLGDYGTARDRCQAALTLSRHHRNRDNESSTLDSLGFVEHHSGHHRLAIEYYCDALSLRRDIGHTYQVANTLDRIGHPHAALGQYERAGEAWREALQLYEEQGRDDDAARVRHQLDDLAARDRSSPGQCASGSEPIR